MGMFDDLKCEYPLPLGASQGELAGRNWRRNGFQTKDFDCLMDQYCIREDGTLWRQIHAWGSGRKGRLRRKAAGWEPLSGFVSTVRFYDFIYGNQADYLVEWVAVIVAGRVAELRLEKWEEHDNRERLSREAEWKLERERREPFLATWIGQRLYPSYAWLVHGCIRFGICGFFHRLGNACICIARILDRVADSLAPFGDPIRAANRHRAWEEQMAHDDDE